MTEEIKMTFQLSEQQQQVLDWVTQGHGSLNLIARAGCGKTFTLLQVVKTIVERGGGNIYLGAFNKSIAQEVRGKVEDLGIDWRQCQVGTLHSAGFSAWRKVSGNVKVDENKVYGIIDELKNLHPDQHVKESLEKVAPTLKRAVSMAKQRAMGILNHVEDRKAWHDLLDHFGLGDDLPGGFTVKTLIDFSIQVLKKSFDQDYEVIDFDDMILAPLVHQARIWPKDWVLIDEAQDTNPARRALALAMLKKNGRLIAVGDDRQAIYGFAGADADSLGLIQQELSSAILPLNVTYRCPKAVVEVANTWVPDLKAHPSAPEGAVHRIKEEDLPELTRDDAILCRNTKPLVQMAYRLISEGIACHVEGREIGNGLLRLAGRWTRIKTLGALSAKLEEYQDKETTKALAKGKEERADAVHDQVAALQAIISHVVKTGGTTTQQLRGAILALFGDHTDKKKTLTLATVHKSKGMEWDRVFILGMERYMPSPWARKQWQQLQEDNLCYVAVTRAKKELYLVVVQPKEEVR